MKTNCKTLEEEKRKIKEEILKLKEEKRKKKEEIGKIKSIIWEEITKELKVYFKNNPVLRKYNFTNYHIYSNGYYLFIDVLNPSLEPYAINLRSSYRAKGIYRHMNGFFDRVLNITEEEVKIIFHNIDMIFKFMLEREKLHKTYDVISTKKSVLLLMHSFRDIPHFKKLPRDIMILICKKALSF